MNKIFMATAILMVLIGADKIFQSGVKEMILAGMFFVAYLTERVFYPWEWVRLFERKEEENDGENNA